MQHHETIYVSFVGRQKHIRKKPNLGHRLTLSLLTDNVNVKCTGFILVWYNYVDSKPSSSDLWSFTSWYRNSHQRQSPLPMRIQCNAADKAQCRWWPAHSFCFKRSTRYSSPIIPCSNPTYVCNHYTRMTTTPPTIYSIHRIIKIMQGLIHHTLRTPVPSWAHVLPLCHYFPLCLFPQFNKTK